MQVKQGSWMLASKFGCVGRCFGVSGLVLSLGGRVACRPQGAMGRRIVDIRNVTKSCVPNKPQRSLDFAYQNLWVQKTIAFLWVWVRTTELCG